MKRKTKRITKEPLHLLRNRCDGLWRDAVLSRWGGKCKVCNKNEATQVHHIFHKGANNAFRFHLRNGLPVCTGCHLREKYNPSVVVMRAIETHGSEMHLLWTEVKRHAGRHVWTRAQLEAVEARMREVVTT